MLLLIAVPTTAIVIFVPVLHVALGEPPERLRSLAGSLLTVAEILSGVVGFIAAISFFAVEQYAARLGRASFLTPVVLRKANLAPLAAATLAAVVVNGSVGLTGEVLPGGGWAAALVAAMDLFALPALMLYAIRLLLSALGSVAGGLDTAEFAETFRQEHQRHLDAEAQILRERRKDRRWLEDNGWRYDRFVWFVAQDEIIELPAGVRGRGSLVGSVKHNSLEQIGRVLKAWHAEAEFGISALPNDELKVRVPHVWIRGGHDTDDRGLRTRRQLPRLPEQVRLSLNRPLRRLFRAANPPSDEVVQFVPRLMDSLKAIARDRPVDELEKVLDLAHELIRQRLEHGVTGLEDSVHSMDLPRYLAGNAVGDPWQNAAIAAAERPELARWSVMLRYANHLMIDGLTHRRPRLFQSGMWSTLTLYQSLPKLANTKDREEFAGEVDADLENSFLLPVFSIRRSGDTTALTADQLAHAVAVVRNWCGLVLELFRLAIEHGRARDAGYFLDRLRYQNSDLRRQSLRLYDAAEAVGGVKQITTPLIYSEIIAVGWCVEVLREPAGRSAESLDAASAALARLVAKDSLPNQDDLLDAWYREKRSGPVGGIIDVGRWSRPEPMRPGIVYSGFGGAAWPALGLFAELLRAGTGYIGDQESLSDITPLSVDAAEQHIKTLYDVPRVREALRLNEDQAAAAASDEVNRLIARRRRVHRLGQLRRVVEGEPNAEVLRALEDEVERAVAKKKSLSATVLQRSSPEASPVDGAHGIHGTYEMPKRRLLAETAEIDAFSDQAFPNLLIGQFDHECARRIVEAAPVVGAASTEVDLKAKLETAAAELREAGYEPDLILLPQQERFALPFFPEARRWNFLHHGEFGGAHIGRWHGIDLFEYPYCHPESAVVIDAKRFFANTERAVRVTLEEPLEQENRALYESALRDEDREVPDTGDVRVVLKAAFEGGSPLRVADPNAARAVEIDLASLGYVLPETGEKYHKPGCRLAPGPGTSLCRNLREDEHRQPCQVCNPDNWDRGR